LHSLMIHPGIIVGVFGITALIVERALGAV
jgi:hypothetical protein